MESMMPPGLEQPTPRAVRRTSTLAYSVVTFGAIMFLPLVIILGTSGVQAHKYNILKTTGVVTQGQVAGTRITTGKTRACFVQYIFDMPAENGMVRRVTSESAVACRTLNSFKVKNVIPVIYDPKNWKRSSENNGDWVRTTDPFQRYMRPALMAQVWLLGFTAFVFLCLYFAYRKEKYLLRWGKCAPAKIIKEQKVCGRGGCHLLVTYEFSDEAEQTRIGMRGSLPLRTDAGEKSQATLSTILDHPVAVYDPANSKRSMLYPGQYVTCVTDEPISSG